MALECTFMELDAVGEVLGLPLRRFPFTFPHYGNGINRAALHAEVGASLAERGLLQGNRFVSELQDVLTLFGTGEPSIGLLGTSGEKKLSALGVFGPDRGVVAVPSGEGIRFDFVPRDRIVPAIVAQLPPMAGALEGSPLARPRLGGGTFLVDRRSIGWVDTEDGRFLAVTSRAPDGRARIEYSPGGPVALERQLRLALA